VDELVAADVHHQRRAAQRLSVGLDVDASGAVRKRAISASSSIGFCPLTKR